jgi:hypothetical protein
MCVNAALYIGRWQHTRGWTVQPYAKCFVHKHHENREHVIGYPFEDIKNEREQTRRTAVLQKCWMLGNRSVLDGAKPVLQDSDYREIACM